MKIDISKIKKIFPDKAWAYAEQYDSVRIGKWDGSELMFYKHKPLDENDAKYLKVLRVFDEKRELKFTGDKCRYTGDYAESDYISELANIRYYYMYGEQKPEHDDGYSSLSEERGGTIWFPAKLTFPTDKIGLKLGIRNYVRYNEVNILPKNEQYSQNISTTGAGALEVFDYAYTGFYYGYDEGKKVEL